MALERPPSVQMLIDFIKGAFLNFFALIAIFLLSPPLLLSPFRTLEFLLDMVLYRSSLSSFLFFVLFR